MFKVMRVRDWLVVVFLIKVATFVALTSGWLTILPSIGVVAAAFSWGRYIGTKEMEEEIKKHHGRRTVANMLYEREVETILDRQRILNKAQELRARDNRRPHGGGDE